MNFKIQQAIDFARRAHKDQRRKYTNEPYHNHCMNVALLVKRSSFNSEDAVIAALLHDTIEDCDVTQDQLADTFGFDVADLVWCLTDQSTKEDGNREVRKKIDRDHLMTNGSMTAFGIKCADLIDNTKSIREHDPKFAKVYLPEKKLLLDTMAERLPDITERDLWKEAYLYL